MKEKPDTLPDGLRIVVIDDDAPVLKAIEMALSYSGFEAKGFDNPLRGIEWIEKNGADVVISDIRMPALDGFGVLQRVKAIDPSCDVIFITAHGQLDIAIRALREGATDFFEKPVTTEILRAAMERTQRYRLLVQQKNLLTEQVMLLSREMIWQGHPGNMMIGQADAMRRIVQKILDVATTDTTVLILGESGTGKELVAKAIHASSNRKEKPFLTINCPSIPEELFESEVFGHRRGAFTGAIENRGGYVMGAAEGTLFLDEIGDLPLKSQSKFLRLLEQKTYLPVGENKEREANVRIIAATNQSLKELVEQKKFRNDLFYRLNVCTLELPPLRDRKEDIGLLSLYFMLHYAHELDKDIDGLADKTLAILMAHDYPGNIRELKNIMESAIIHVHHTGLLEPDDLPNFLTQQNPSNGSAPNWPIETIRFEEVEKRLYLEAMNRFGSNVSAAARELGLSRGKLRRRLAALKIDSETADEAPPA